MTIACRLYYSKVIFNCWLRYVLAKGVVSIYTTTNTDCRNLSRDTPVQSLAQSKKGWRWCLQRKNTSFSSAKSSTFNCVSDTDTLVSTSVYYVPANKSTNTNWCLGYFVHSPVQDSGCKRQKSRGWRLPEDLQHITDVRHCLTHQNYRFWSKRQIMHF